MQSTAQNALTQQDSKWLDSSFTKVFCIITAQLHVYGAGPALDQSGGPTPPVPDQLYKPAITNAIAAVKHSLCGPSAVLLASQSGQGPFTPAHSEPDACNPHPPRDIHTSVHVSIIDKGDWLNAESVLLTPDGPKSQCPCKDLKPRQGQAVDVQVLSRGLFLPAPVQPPAIVYQAAAGKSCTYLRGHTQ